MKKSQSSSSPMDRNQQWGNNPSGNVFGSPFENPMERIIGTFCRWLLVAGILFSFSNPPSLGAGDAAYPAPKYLGDEAQLGRGVQRTMSLLASSTPNQRNTVRVLFYGQSITSQDWSRQVAEDLRHRFPDANLTIENRAIGGHSSQLLVKTVEADLYPFQPDLVIFHVYGSHLEYENIIRGIRERTTAEVLIQNDHVNKVADLTEEMDPAKIGFDKWDSFMNHKFLPATAAKYNTGYLDQRAAWKRYLADFQLAPSVLLRDGVHLNDHGCFVMAQFVNAYLRVNPAVDDGSWKAWVRTFKVGDAVTWERDHLVVEFEGERIDAIASSELSDAGGLEAWIDGKRPSEITELRTFNRVSAFPQSDWPCLLRVQSEAPLRIEDWALTLTETSDDLKTVKFTLLGSVTGEDGEGISTERFVSRSGRIVIEPEDWNLAYCRQVHQHTVRAGHRITWKVIPLFQDTFWPVPSEDPSIENVVTLAQGLGQGVHHLELRGKSAANLSALRVYLPPGSL